MPTQLYLIAGPDIAPELIDQALADGEVSVLLLTPGTLTENAYKTRVTAIRDTAQAAGTALLVMGQPGLVEMLGVDGLHLDAPGDDLDAAIERLRPRFIVGVGGLTGRHEAMMAGEKDVDYVLFGPLAGPVASIDAELAQWWAETMEVPGVYADPLATPADFVNPGTEFVALSDGLWNAKQGPRQALAEARSRLETT